MSNRNSRANVPGGAGEDARAGAAGYALPASAAAVLGGGLLAGFYLGSKWLALVALAYLFLAGLMIMRDRRLAVVSLVSACIPLGLQYNVWTHGNKFAFMEHFGGAPPEPVIFLVDLPILLLAVFWLYDLRAGRKRLPQWTRTDAIAAAFLGVSLLSVFNTDEYNLVIFETIRYSKYFLVYLMLKTYLDRPIAFWGVLAAQIAVLSIQGMVSAMQYFMNFVLPIPVGGMAGGSVAMEMVGTDLIQRVSGLLGHCNTFSAYLSVTCCFCLIVLFARVKPWMRAAALPFFAAGVLSLVLTFSRNGWMVFAFNAVGVALWASYTRRLRFWMVPTLIFVCTALVGALAVSGVLDTIFTRVFRTDGKEFDSRWDLTLVAWEMIKSHPIIGIGFNTFEESMIRFDPHHITHIIRQPVHNGFLLVAAETGLPALGLFLALLWRQIRLSAFILKRDDELHFAVGAAGMVVFVGLGLANLFDVTWRKESVLGLIVLASAMLSALARLDEEASGSAPPERVPASASQVGNGIPVTTV